MKKSILKLIAISGMLVAMNTDVKAQSWSLTGNAGTTAASNFIGTTDNVALRFRTKNVNRMTINTSGNVGIGTTSPLSSLHVQKTLTGTPITTPVLARFSNSTINGYTKVILGSDNSSSDGFSTFTAGSTASTQLLGFGVGNAGSTVTQLNINGDGNVGIGTTSPTQNLHIERSNAVSTSMMLRNTSSNISYYLATYGSTGAGTYWAGQGSANTTGIQNIGGPLITGATNGLLFSGSLTAEHMRITNNGNVGIGTSTPAHKLDVAGRMRVQTGGGNAGIWLMDPGNSFDAAFWGIIDLNHMGFYASVLGNWGMTMNLDNGNIGIGTTSPAYKLDVCGTIRSKEVRVETGWCDYVFADDYKLATLNEVETYIKENKHLPGVTAGSVIETDGLEVGKVSAQMIKKIEELTLYVIQQEKSIESLKLQNSALENKINSVVAKGGN